MKKTWNSNIYLIFYIVVGVILSSARYQTIVRSENVLYIS